MRVLACGCVLGAERCFDCRYGLDADQEKAATAALQRMEARQNENIEEWATNLANDLSKHTA